MNGSFNCPKCRQPNRGSWILVKVEQEGMHMKVCKKCKDSMVVKPVVDTSFYDAAKAKMAKERKEANDRLIQQLRDKTLIKPPGS
jgi:hypothetical protein